MAMSRIELSDSVRAPLKCRHTATWLGALATARYSICCEPRLDAASLASRQSCSMIAVRFLVLVVSLAFASCASAIINPCALVGYATADGEHPRPGDVIEFGIGLDAFNKGGRPRSVNPRKLITIRLPEDVIERWKATGPGWKTRMAQRLSKLR
jgi:hypothetical protein